MADVLVVGCGLIGTSIGLALRQAGQDVLLHDTDPSRIATAARRGAGKAWNSTQNASLVLVAVPPAAVAAQLYEAQRHDLGRTYTHVTSVQSEVQSEVEALSCDLSSIVGSHPLAGRETSGPDAASADLFVGRPWAVCPSPSSADEAVEAVLALVETCGATPVVVDAGVHDASVARLSHLPHVLSAALAGRLTVAPGQGTDLSGPGLVDATRLAAGDPALWAQILTANAGPVAQELRAVVADLSALAEDLGASLEPGAADAARERVLAFLTRGQQGRAQVPVKRGERSAAFASVVVEVDDRPGRLAALLTDAGELGVNVEDVRVEHVPGRPRGSISLVVALDAATRLAEGLSTRGWDVPQARGPGQ
jgi:prephenate dehydrogenase